MLAAREDVGLAGRGGADPAVHQPRKTQEANTAMSNRTTPDTSNGTADNTRARPMLALLEQGQSLWLDYITRDLVRGGELRTLIEREGLRGMTSNPTLFEKAIGAGNAYDGQIGELADSAASSDDIFEAVAIRDVRDACDLFRHVYDATHAVDGYVSLEVSPRLAADANATFEAGKRLWGAVDRPNVMIKVPGTAECIPAITRLLRDGVNVNVTLLFSQASHQRVMNAYLDALEARAVAGEPLDRVASVASFFVSRIDTAVDAELDAVIERTGGADAERLRTIVGKVAIANAKLAYANFRRTFDSPRFETLRQRGARVQRPLWASTGTKNKSYRDVLYVEELIGRDTVNTLPLETMKAMLDHGNVRSTLSEGVDEAKGVVAQLEGAGIDLNAVTKKLETDGIASFTKSYGALLERVAEKRKRLRGM